MKKGSQYNIKIKKTASVKKTAPAELFSYQQEAIKNLEHLDSIFSNYYSTLLVVPTGGGKTRIAVDYIYKNVMSKKGHKVLWIAERLLLLKQAYDTFRELANSEHLTGKEESEVVTRLISSKHGNYENTHFHKEVDLVIITQQTLEKKIDRDSQIISAMKEWLTGSECLTIIIDEAHHAVEEPYKAILQSLLKLRKSDNFKSCHIIGLTATPKKNESDRIEEIFSFGIIDEGKDGLRATSETSYAYQISIHDLVSKEVLSIPYMSKVEGYKDKDETIRQIYCEGISYLNFYDGQTGKKETADLKKIPSSFGQTIIFAESRIHALKLERMFRKINVECGLAISIDSKLEKNIKKRITEREIKNYIEKPISEKQKQIKQDIEKFKNGNLSLIITVDMLLEGVDIPKVQTVFIARSNIDDVEVTQMVGRALRGKFQGGTPTAFIVSFGNDKLEKILWEIPDSYSKDRDNKELDVDFKLSKTLNPKSIEPFFLSEKKFEDGIIKQEEIDRLLWIEQDIINSDRQTSTANRENILLRDVIMERTALLPTGYYLLGKRALLVWEGMNTWIDEILKNIDNYKADEACLKTRDAFHIKANEILNNNFELADEEKKGFLPKDIKERYLWYFMRFYMLHCGQCKKTFWKSAGYHEFMHLEQYDLSGVLKKSIGKSPDEFDEYIKEIWNQNEEDMQKAWHDEETFKCFLKPKLMLFNKIRIEPITEEEYEGNYFRVRVYREGRKRRDLCEMLKQIVGGTTDSCSRFVDVFGGTGTVTAQMKGIFSKRIYNDFDVNLANFIYCVADKEIGKMFARFCYDQVGDLVNSDMHKLIIQGKKAIEVKLGGYGQNDRDIQKVYHLDKVIEGKIENLKKHAKEKKVNKREVYNERLKNKDKNSNKQLNQMRAYMLGRYRQLTKEKKMLEDSKVKDIVKKYIAFYYLTNWETDKLSSSENIRTSLNNRKILDYNEMKVRAFRFLFSRGFPSNKVSGQSVTGIDSTGILRFNRHMDWKKGTSWLTEFHDKMQGVEVSCRDFRKILNTYNEINTVFYLDPPYFLTCQYDQGFPDDYHLDMLEWLRTTESKWVLSCKDKSTNKTEAVNWKCRIGSVKRIIYVKNLRDENPRLDEYFKGFLYPMKELKKEEADSYWRQAGIQGKEKITVYCADAQSKKRKDKLFVYWLADEKYKEIMISNIEVRKVEQIILKDHGILMKDFEEYFSLAEN